MSQNFENAIRERFEQGFKNWNNGYDAWLDWCETLYEPDAHYNVYSDRLTLQQYKDMMGQLFQAYDIEQKTMEFVKFKENPEPIGVRVIEGWALSDKPLSAH